MAPLSAMERSRSDVYQRTIDEQNQKLEKYQAKLRGDWFILSLIIVLLLLTRFAAPASARCM